VVKKMRKISSAAIRMNPTVTTHRVVARDGCFLPPRSGGGDVCASSAEVAV
jgi:hypothetical protein